MKTSYVKFVVSLLALSTLMFIIWLFVAGIENAREMLFVITVFAACISAKSAIYEAFERGRNE